MVFFDDPAFDPVRGRARECRSPVRLMPAYRPNRVKALQRVVQAHTRSTVTFHQVADFLALPENFTLSPADGTETSRLFPLSYKQSATGFCGKHRPRAL